AATTGHRLEARLLGGLTLLYDDHPLPEVAFHRRQSLTLLLRLLVEPTHRLPTDSIMELLWPEQDPQAATANLRAVLSGIRSAPPDRTAPNPVARLGDALALQPGLVLSLDLDLFEATAASALTESDPGALRAALALYAGSLLPGLSYEEWVEERRAA